TREGAPGMTTPLTIECAVRFEPRRRGRKELAVGPAPAGGPPGRGARGGPPPAPAAPLGGLLRAGRGPGHPPPGGPGPRRLGPVPRARVSQLMSLLYLAPDLQEQILFLPRPERGRDPVILRDLLPIAAVPNWKRQRRLWQALLTPRTL